MKLFIVQSPFTLQSVKQERAQHLFPLRRVNDLRVELHAVDRLALGCAAAAKGVVLEVLAQSAT